MRSNLFFIPIIAIAVGLIGTITPQFYTSLTWTIYVGWGIAAVLFGVWYALDTENFKEVLGRNAQKFWLKNLVVILMAFTAFGLVTHLSKKARFTKTWDLTRDKSNTLSDQSVKVVQNLAGQNVTVKIEAFLAEASQTADNRKVFFEQLKLYQGVKDIFSITTFDPLKDTQQTKARGLSSETVILSARGREFRITSFTEESITNALLKLSKEGESTILFTTGHGEPDINGQEELEFSTLVNELKNMETKVDVINLMETPQIAANTDVVVIAGLKVDFRKNEIDALDAYLAQGGRLLLSVPAISTLPLLNGLLTKYGLSFEDDLLITDPNTPFARSFSPELALITWFSPEHPITKSLSAMPNMVMSFPMMRSLTIHETNEKNMKVESILKTNAQVLRIPNVKKQSDVASVDSRNLKGGEHVVMVSATAPSTTPPAPSPEAGKEAEAAPVSPPGGAKIVAIGTEYLGNNASLTVPQNRDLVLNSLDYLMDSADSIAIRPRDKSASEFSITSPASYLTLFFINFVFPFLFLFAGILLWILRGRK